MHVQVTLSLLAAVQSFVRVDCPHGLELLRDGLSLFRPHEAVNRGFSGRCRSHCGDTLTLHTPVLWPHIVVRSCCGWAVSNSWNVQVKLMCFGQICGNVGRICCCSPTGHYTAWIPIFLSFPPPFLFRPSATKLGRDGLMHYGVTSASSSSSQDPLPPADPPLGWPPWVDPLPPLGWPPCLALHCHVMGSRDGWWGALGLNADEAYLFPSVFLPSFVSFSSVSFAAIRKMASVSLPLHGHEPKEDQSETQLTDVPLSHPTIACKLPYWLATPHWCGSEAWSLGTFAEINFFFRWNMKSVPRVQKNDLMLKVRSQAFLRLLRCE